MSGNAELARRFYDAFNRRDLDAFLALTHEDVVMESRLTALEGAYVGHEGARRWYDDFVGAFPDYTVDPHPIRELGDVTIAHVGGRGHGVGSATPLIDPFWQTMRWRDGKCIWWRNFPTEAEALAAAGVADS